MAVCSQCFRALTRSSRGGMCQACYRNRDDLNGTIHLPNDVGLPSNSQGTLFSNAAFLPKPMNEECDIAETDASSTIADETIVDDESQEELIATQAAISESTTLLQSEVLAELCALATSSEIRDCIRLFDSEKSVYLMSATFNRKSKLIITSTLEYLGVESNWDDYVKPECVASLVQRLKNLLPSQCTFCNKLYVANKDDPPLLPCSRCGLEAHRKCVLHTLRIENGTASEVRTLINPFGLSCLHYFCSDCDTSTAVPQKILLVDKHTSKLSINNVNEATIKASEFPNSPFVSTKPDDKEKEEFREPPAAAKINNKNNCRYYMKGRCKHGIKGNACKFLHPKPCTKLLRHGYRSKYGCSKGKDCEFFHPKMCPTSLTKGECSFESCSLRHVKGTKFNRGDATSGGVVGRNECNTKNARLSPTKSSICNTPQPNFLDAVRLMKTELLEAMDLKINALMNQSRAPVQSQFPTQWGRPMQPLMEGTPYMNSSNVVVPPPPLWTASQLHQNFPGLQTKNY